MPELDGTPLCEATEQQLWNELKKRHRAVLLVTEDEVRGSGETNTCTYYSGGINRACGLARRAQVNIEAEMRRDVDSDRG